MAAAATAPNVALVRVSATFFSYLRVFTFFLICSLAVFCFKLKNVDKSYIKRRLMRVARVKFFLFICSCY